ncbi:hypothetical protein OF83DRAFT_1088072, partial [Amylostereum chailletii]
LEPYQEYNVHFLSTSNLVLPLEILDSFVDQLSSGTVQRVPERWCRVVGDGKAPEGTVPGEDCPIPDMTDNADIEAILVEFAPGGRPSVMELRSQFAAGKVVGGMSAVKKMRTASGIKDTFQNVFLERLFSITKRKGASKPRKQEEVDRFVAEELPGNYIHYIPIW